LAVQACSPPSNPAPAEPAAEAAPSFHADFSVREVMTYIIDPVADYVWDAVSTDVTEKGVVETVPKTDEDWDMVMRGAVSLAEGANLLKIRRKAAPEHDYVSKNPNELQPSEIDALIAKSPNVWNAYADALRNEALKIAEIAKARDASRLTQAGTDLDRVCEACHLQYWYPVERELVERNRNSKVIQPSQGQGR
jgi:hypothetical protein